MVGGKKERRPLEKRSSDLDSFSAFVMGTGTKLFVNARHLLLHTFLHCVMHSAIRNDILFQNTDPDLGIKLQN